MAGAYYNSVEDVSTYIGYRFEHEDFGLEIAGVQVIQKLMLFQSESYI